MNYETELKLLGSEVDNMYQRFESTLSREDGRRIWRHF